MDTANIDENAARRSRLLWLHFLVFSAASVLMIVIDLLLSGERWFHWPVMVWGAVVGGQFLYCKSLSVDENWAEERSNKLRLKSYDLGHIQDIEGSYKESQSAEEPPKS